MASNHYMEAFKRRKMKSVPDEEQMLSQGMEGDDDVEIDEEAAEQSGTPKGDVAPSVKDGGKIDVNINVKPFGRSDWGMEGEIEGDDPSMNKPMSKSNPMDMANMEASNGDPQEADLSVMLGGQQPSPDELMQMAGKKGGSLWERAQAALAKKKLNS